MIGIIQSPHVQAEQQEAVLVDNQYNFEVIAKQFEFTFIDLNRVDQLLEDGANYTTARSQATFKDEIPNLKSDAEINLTIYSTDVLHGFIIARLDISTDLEAPTNNVVKKYNFTRTLPSDDIILTAFCNVWCGSAHENMRFSLIVGDGEPDFQIFGADWISLAWILSMVVVIIGIIAIALVKPFWKTEE